MKKKTTRVAFAFCALAATALVQTPGRAFGADEASTEARTLPLPRLTPLIGRTSSDATDPQMRFSGAYTRLMILSRGTRDIAHHDPGTCDVSADETGAATPQASQPTFVPYNDRGWFARLYNGRQYTVNFTITMTVGDFKATVPLVTLEHDSNTKDGEKFVRLINHSAQNFPLFLVKADGSNAIASLKPEVRISNKYTGQSAAAAIKVATDLLGIVSPQSKVLTTLTTQKTKDAASGLDAALNSLLQQVSSEDQSYDNDVRRWGSVCAQFLLPRDESKLPRLDGDLQMIGNWMVVFEDPRPSIFDDVQICDSNTKRRPTSSDRWCEKTFQDAAKVAESAALRRPAEVLDFELIQGQKTIGTVKAFLKQQDWWTKSIQDLTANAPKAEKPAPGKAEKPAPSETEKLAASAADFCLSIKGAIASLGLNEVDEGIVTAAVRDGITLPEGAAKAMQSQAACRPAIAL
jgi:hypothetical protein